MSSDTHAWTPRTKEFASTAGTYLGDAENNVYGRDERVGGAGQLTSHHLGQSEGHGQPQHHGFGLDASDPCSERRTSEHRMRGPSRSPRRKSPVSSSAASLRPRGFGSRVFSLTCCKPDYLTLSSVNRVPVGLSRALRSRYNTRTQATSGSSSLAPRHRQKKKKTRKLGVTAGCARGSALGRREQREARGVTAVPKVCVWGWQRHQAGTDLAQMQRDLCLQRGRGAPEALYTRVTTSLSRTQSPSR